MVGQVLTQPPLGEGVFIGRWESGRWREHTAAIPAISPAPPVSGPDGPAVSPAGPDISPEVRRLRRADPAPRRKRIQYTDPAAPPGWSGQPPDGPVRGPARPGGPPKTESVYQSGGSAGLVRSAAGWPGLGTGQTILGHFLAGDSTIFLFMH
jgi:hypothetical protein